MVADPPRLTLVRIDAETAPTAAAFLASMPEGDRTFFKEPIDERTPQRWGRDQRTVRWLARIEGEDEPVGWLAIEPGTGWRSHVGELRLIVAASHRRRGIGAELARRGLVAGLEMGLRKVTVEVVADKPGDIAMFTAIGFDVEALLRDHFQRPSGTTHDLAILSHMVDEVGEDLELVGIDLAVGGPAGPGGAA